MNGRPEVLAPAGGPESLTAAVRAGADAVYLGAPGFSARAGARNFDRGALREAVAYCHARGVRVHLALNTLLLDSELCEALRLAEYACSLPVDAVIVQDMGLLRLLAERAPGLPLHASTQMSVHTPAAVRVLEEAGVSRVVLAREMSLREIAAVRAATRAELEAFVHGALCMSVSGQCYFSAMLGGRSGNRGCCAQPCRLPFSAGGGTGYDLSLKDLSMIPRARALFEAGVCSLKIEGRMKRPEYVAAATRACRLAADGEPPPPDLLEALRAVFSRSGFTTGYPDGRLGREMFGARTKEDVAAATEQVLARLRGLYRSEARRVPVRLAFTAAAGEPASLIAADGQGRAARARGPVPESVRSRPLTGERCAEQLAKTGGTPFYAESVSCAVGPGLSLSASALNAMRREALASLERLRAVPPEGAPVWNALPMREPEPRNPRPGPPALRLRFARADQVPDEARACERVFLPSGTPPETLARLLERGFPVAAELPRGLFGMEDAVREELRLCRAAGVTGVWAGTLDAVGIARESGLRIHGGFSLNMTNTEALRWYEALGLADAELSPELGLRQAGALGASLPRGVLAYGRLPLMLCRNCPAANGPGGCRRCGTPPVLTDRRGVSFPIMCAGACSEVLNSVPLYLADCLGGAGGLDFITLRFTTETREEAAAVIGQYRAALAGSPPEPPESGFTRGLSRTGWPAGA